MARGPAKRPSCFPRAHSRIRDHGHQPRDLVVQAITLGRCGTDSFDRDGLAIRHICGLVGVDLAEGICQPTPLDEDLGDIAASPASAAQSITKGMSIQRRVVGKRRAASVGQVTAGPLGCLMGDPLPAASEPQVHHHSVGEAHTVDVSPPPSEACWPGPPTHRRGMGALERSSSWHRSGYQYSSSWLAACTARAAATRADPATREYEILDGVYRPLNPTSTRR